jgi:adenylate cyclase
MGDRMDEEYKDEEVWRSYLLTGEPPKGVPQLWFESPLIRPFARHLPTEPRCKVCHYPFGGIGGRLVRTFLGVRPSKMNPHMCNVCERFADRFRGGAEVDATFLFADVRGSTGIAKSMSAVEYGRLIDRFYRSTTKALYKHNGMVEKLIGDEVTGFFVPAFSGDDHARSAVGAAQDVLLATGQGQQAEPWIPVGVGVHTGTAYIGSIGVEGGGVDIAVLGEDVNTAALLAEKAGAGEVWITDAVRSAVGIDDVRWQARHMAEKDRDSPLTVWTLKVS